MIGGFDIVLKGPANAHDTDMLVRGIRGEWPTALVQRADEEQAVSMGALRFPIIGPAELIVYRDRASHESWTRFGATPDNQDAMIHIIASREAITLVVDRRGSPLEAFARELLESLRANRIVPGTPQAA